MRRFLFLIAIAALSLGVLFVLSKDGEGFDLKYSSAEAESITTFIPSLNSSQDIENQKPLANPPSIIKAVYATAWTAGGKGLDRLIELIKKTELNAIVIDIKDYSGVISYDTQVPEVLKYKTKEIRTPRINSIIKRLHDEGIYVIARQTVFQDPALVKARPDLAVKNKSTGKPWTDNKGISWADPASKEVWDYDVAIARDALARGFDEINFDYIRFPSDGKTSLMTYPFYNPATTYKKDVIRQFFQYLRSSLAGSKISADVFGYTTINQDDLGIGQIIEYAYENFDYVSPMVYPSHFNDNFLGYPKPAKNPYEVIKYTSDVAFARLRKYLAGVDASQVTNSTADTAVVSPAVNRAKLRPWFQDFSLGGVVYGADKVLAQIKAYDASATGYSDLYGGWLLWSASNVYTSAALKPN